MSEQKHVWPDNVIGACPLVICIHVNWKSNFFLCLSLPWKSRNAHCTGDWRLSSRLRIFHRSYYSNMSPTSIFPTAPWFLWTHEIQGLCHYRLNKTLTPSLSLYLPEFMVLSLPPQEMTALVKLRRQRETLERLLSFVLQVEQVNDLTLPQSKLRSITLAEF